MSVDASVHAELTGVTVRTLHHYDELGLLSPSGRSEAGYRLYSHADLARLREILIWRALGFPDVDDDARVFTDADIAALRAFRTLIDSGKIRPDEEIPHVRVEACDTCHSYIKTIDMTKDGRAVPVVDELAAIPLSLWAVEKGYEKVRGNLLGV